VSARALRFGVQLSLKPPQEQFDLVRRIEALGFDSVWTGDHVSFHNPMYESLTLLATYVPITSRLRLGTAVYLLALRRPAIAAKITSTLDVLSGGRLIFGVGVGGENPKEFEVCGVPHAERGARVTEAIDAVRTLWRDTPATFKGRFTSFAGISIDPKPVQKPGPPIWIGGRSDAALARAGRQGDGWVSYVVQPERYAQSLDKIRAAAAAAGRTLDNFAAAHLAFVTVGRDYETAKAVWAGADEALRPGLRAARPEVRNHRHARAVRGGPRAFSRRRLQLRHPEPDRPRHAGARAGRASRGRRDAEAGAWLI